MYSAFSLRAQLIARRSGVGISFHFIPIRPFKSGCTVRTSNLESTSELYAQVHLLKYYTTMPFWLLFNKRRYHNKYWNCLWCHKDPSCPFITCIVKFTSKNIQCIIDLVRWPFYFLKLIHCSIPIHIELTCTI